MSFAVTASFALAPLPVASAPLLSVRTPFLGNDFEMFHIFFAATRNGRSYSLLRALMRKKKAQWRQWLVYKADQRAIPEAHGGSVSFNVTGRFPFLRPWHCVEVSLLPPCTCRRESLPRRRLAQRARRRAFGNLSYYPRCFTPTFAEACAAWWKNHSSLRRFCCASGLRVCHSVQEFVGLTRPHPSAMRCLSVLVAPMCFCLYLLVFFFW